MSPAKPRRMDGYIRVSRVGTRDTESDRYQTEHIQREKIEAWAKLRDVEIAAWHIDRDQSGSKLSRPGFDACMARIQGGATEGIVVAAIDRLSRADVADALMIVRKIHDDFKGTMAAVDLGLDPTTEVGEMMLTVLLALARMQWRRYQSAWATAKERAVERGAFIAQTPIGYARTDDGRLEVDPFTADVVLGAFKAAATQGLRAAVDYLQRYLPAVRTWNTVSARRLLINRVYLGESTSGELTNRTSHPALIDLATWTAAAKQAGANLEDHRPSGTYVLSHVARCAACDTPLIGNRGRSANHRGYRCPRNKSKAVRDGAERCPAPALIAAERLEDYVLAELTRYVAENQPCDQAVLIEAVNGPDLDAAQRALDSAKMAQQRDLEDVRLRELLGDDMFYERMRAHVRAVDGATEQFERASVAAHAVVSWPLVDEIATAPIEDLPGLLDKARVSVRVAQGRAPLADRVALVPWAPVAAVGPTQSR